MVPVHRPKSVDGLLADNTVDGTQNISPGQAGQINRTSGVGVWIGVALGLIVVIGLMIVGIYFYRWDRTAVRPLFLCHWDFAFEAIVP